MNCVDCACDNARMNGKVIGNERREENDALHHFWHKECKTLILPHNDCAQRMLP